MKKVLAVSSPGGHWIQLNKICELLEAKHNVVYAMSSTQIKADPKRTIYSLPDASADSKLKLIPAALKTLYILFKERPDVVLSTGAAPGLLAVLLGKIVGAKTIWVDSIANVKKISRSGRIVQSRVDIFITQWEPLSNNKDILYKGSVL